MYGNSSVLGVSVAAGGLAATGFGLTWYVLIGTFLLLSGLLLVRFGRRRSAGQEA